MDLDGKEFLGLVEDVGGLERELQKAYRDLRDAEERKKLVNDSSAQEAIEKAQSTWNALGDSYSGAPKRISDYLKKHKPVLDVEYAEEQKKYQIILRCPSLASDTETLKGLRYAVQFSRLYVEEKVEDKVRYHKLYSAITGDNFGTNIGARGDINIHAIGPGSGIGVFQRISRVIRGKENPKGYLQLLGYNCSPLGSDSALAIRNMLMKIKEEGLMDTNIKYKNMKENELRVA